MFTLNLADIDLKGDDLDGTINEFLYQTEADSRQTCPRSHQESHGTEKATLV